MMTIAIDSELERRLEALGAKDAEAKAALARQALVRALDEELESDREWARLADERKAKEADEAIWTLDQLERGDDLAG